MIIQLVKEKVIEEFDSKDINDALRAQETQQLIDRNHTYFLRIKR